jgi:Tetracyclin repressor-like, C-terminal domain
MLFADTIKQIQNKGRMGSDIKPSWAALFLLGMLTWTTYWFDFDRKGSVDAITDLAEKLVFNALGLNQGDI